MVPIAAGQPPGWKTKTHKRYTLKDRQLLQEMEDAVRSGPQACRRLFCVPCADVNVSSVSGHSLRKHETPFLVPYSRTTRPIQPLSQHAHPIPFRSLAQLEVGPHSTPQAVQQRQLPRVTQNPRHSITFSVEQQTTRVLREVAAYPGIWTVACKTRGGRGEGFEGECRTGSGRAVVVGPVVV